MQPHESLKEISQEFTEKTLQHGEISFSFLVVNESAARSIVLVHGVTGNKYDMVVVGREYARKGYAVYIPDLPGHGAAPFMKVDSFTDLSKWLYAFIESIERNPDVLMGNSFGSAICYHFAQMGLLSQSTQLVLACPTPKIATLSRALREASGLLPEHWVSAPYNASWAIQFRTNYLITSSSRQARVWLEESERMKKAFLNVKMANAVSTLLRTDNPYDGVQLSPEVQRRTTVVVGAKDNVITKDSLSLLRERLPEAHFIVVPQVGHILHFEAYQQLGGAVDAVA